MALEHAHDWEDDDFATGFQLISELWGEDGLTAADFIDMGC